MVKVLARFSAADHREFDVSYGRASLWTKYHDKSAAFSYVSPDIDALEEEIRLAESWFIRVKWRKA